MTTPVLQAAQEVAVATELLTSQEGQYVAARMMGNPPVIAARSAGYRDPIERSMALEQDLRIRQAMQASTRLSQYQRRLTRDDVLAGFLDAAQIASTATELVGAWREIGRVIGAYEPAKVNVNVVHELKEMGDQELAQLAAVDGEFEVLEFTTDEQGT